VLLVVDNSGSMVEEQEKLANNFESFIGAFLEGDVDYHIGVVTTDVANVTDQGRLEGDTKIITRDTPNPEAVFAENVQVGTSGSGAEMGLEAARLALSEPLLSTDNAGFYRSDASLSIVIVSDENDLSPWSVDDYLNWFSALKGEASYRDHRLMNISAVVGDVPYGCDSADGTSDALPGTRYVDASTQTEGIFASICASDFGPLIQALGLDISGLRDEFPLTRCPRVDTLEVTVKVPGEDDLVQAMGTDYSFVPEAKSIRFQSDAIPPPDAEIEIHYAFYGDDVTTCPAQ